MKILSCDYIKSAPSLKDCPDFGAMPEIALVGRSNVGKSSFINSMASRKNIARTSNTPGKTRYINFYKLSYTHPKVKWSEPGKLLFVDLPGYGYAKVSHEEQARWKQNLETYLSKRTTLRGVVQLFDARHGPQDSDIAMFEWLQFHGKRVFLLMTKCDKIKRGDLIQTTTRAAKQLDVRQDDILPYSAETHQGRNLMWPLLQTWLDTPVLRNIDIDE
jgi:GTP-binding protein